MTADVDYTWLRKLDEDIWRRSVDRFGHIHAFEKGLLRPGELERVLGIIERDKLPCVLRSGPYGDLSMTVYQNSEFPGVPPELLLHLGEGHIKALEDKKAFQDWKVRFDWFARYTHSDSNRERLRFYKLPEPRPAADYEY